MWHEARKQEKKIRGMMVDYRKRAERRRDFYEKFKADPTQFLQLHGRPCKIHLDPAVAVAGDSASVMMPWQGHPDILIDRFDVRAHLDIITEYSSTKNEEDTLNYEERTMNYERYRILVQNEFLGVNEEKFLNQIYLEEQFGPIALKQSTEMLEKEKRKRGAAIGFTYEDSTPDPLYNGPEKKSKEEAADKEGSDSDDSDLDFDLCLDLSQIDTPSAHEMNSVGQRFGLTGNDFFSFLTNDVEEQEAMRLARQQEEEKAMFSGRKARRERQAFREKKLIGRVMSPPSYAARKSPTYDKYTRCNKSLSRSTSPENAGQITYITSFGGDDSNDEKQEQKTSSNKVCRKSRRRGSRDRDERPTKSSLHRNRRSKSAGSRSRSKSPRRRRKYTRSRSIENRSLASNLKKLISKKNERRSRSGSSDKFRSYSKWRSRSRPKKTVIVLGKIFDGHVLVVKIIIISGSKELNDNTE
ncbi:hypothetical protein RUM44_013678 [Polyplax serrata]|uniref:Suppressor of white apricot N-terminal domain-containing protein n=1 Tax=Polyplax serrata TaxID=468196 RepID=A0ABR1BIH3_POLSC